MGELDGKVAVITNAGSGMGRAAAEVFVREGAEVLAADVSGRQEDTAAIEHGEQGIRANAICPGFIETEMSGGKGAAERFPALVQGSCLRRGGQPEEVAELASFLASDRSAYITGAIIPIDGGSTCCLPS